MKFYHEHSLALWLAQFSKEKYPIQVSALGEEQRERVNVMLETWQMLLEMQTTHNLKTIVKKS